jgi:hypothetical protein
LDEAGRGVSGATLAGDHAAIAQRTLGNCILASANDASVALRTPHDEQWATGSAHNQALAKVMTIGFEKREVREECLDDFALFAPSR